MQHSASYAIYILMLVIFSKPMMGKPRILESLLLFFIILKISSISYAQGVSSDNTSDFQAQVVKQEKVQEDIDEEKISSEQKKMEAEKQAAKAQKIADTTESEAEKSLATYLTNLQNYRAELTDIKLNKVTVIEDKVKLLRDRTEILKKYELKLKKNPESIQLQDLESVTAIWRKIVDDSVRSLFDVDLIQINNFPEQPESVILSGDKYSDLKSKITLVQKESQSEKIEVEQLILRLKRAQRDVQSRLLLNSGRVRARTMSLLISRGEFSVWDLSTTNLEDYFREIKVVPFRFLATFMEKYFDFKSLSQEGLKGWFIVAKQILILLFVFALPFLLFRLFESFSLYLEGFRRKLFTSSQLDFKKRTLIATWIGRLNPYLPWLFALLAIEITKSLLLGTLLGPLSLVLPYFNIYIFYRVFKLLFATLLAKVLLSKSLDKVRSSEPRLQATTRKLSLLFFLEWIFLHATEDVVRQALIYNLIFDTVFYANLILVAIESKKWKTELLELSDKWFSKKIHLFISNNKYAVLDLFLLPILFLGNVCFLAISWVYQWFSQFELGKKLSSEIFKKRLEDASEGSEITSGVLPDDYVNNFTANVTLQEELRVALSRSPFKKCTQTIDHWINQQTNEDLLLLYGNFGIGKTTLLNSLELHYKNKAVIKQVKIDHKVTDPNELFKILSAVFNVPIKDVNDLEKYDKSIDKTLVFIDDIHNLYLNETSGLEAYRLLIDLTSLQLDNIFWCLTCNQKVLVHLNGLYGKDHFLGEKVELLSWIDSEIQDLILKRHSLSKYPLKFDQVISAVHKGDILESSSGIEVQFFRLLWGQSRGNPRTAQELWLSAAYLDQNQVLRIAVPDFTNPRTLADLSDETLMVFAAIVKHENLSYEELYSVCNMSSSHLKQAIKFGEDGLILQKIQENRWRIHPKAQYIVHAQLSGRNLIYG